MRDKVFNTVLLAALIVAAFVIGFEFRNDTVVASTPGNLPATLATSSTAVVPNGDDVFLFAASTNCAARIISTGSSTIRLSMEAATTTGGGPGHYGVASTTINGVYGFVQAASTTVIYPSADYGCPAMNAFSDEGTFITIAETR